MEEIALLKVKVLIMSFYIPIATNIGKNLFYAYEVLDFICKVSLMAELEFFTASAGA